MSFLSTNQTMLQLDLPWALRDTSTFLQPANRMQPLASFPFNSTDASRLSLISAQTMSQSLDSMKSLKPTISLSCIHKLRLLPWIHQILMVFIFILFEIHIIIFANIFLCSFPNRMLGLVWLHWFVNGHNYLCD